MDVRTRAATSSGEQTPLWNLGYLDAAEKDARKFLELLSNFVDEAVIRRRFSRGFLR
jgi:hypothetical protein